MFWKTQLILWLFMTQLIIFMWFMTLLKIVCFERHNYFFFLSWMTQWNFFSVLKDTIIFLFCFEWHKIIFFLLWMTQNHRICVVNDTKNTIFCDIYIIFDDFPLFGNYHHLNIVQVAYFRKLRTPLENHKKFLSRRTLSYFSYLP